MSPSPPHCPAPSRASYAVSAASYRGLAGAAGADQSILVSGESGAGKTEASKLVLLHLLHRAGELRGLGGHGPDEPLRRTLLLCRPVLEALTHAATPANANATRVAPQVTHGGPNSLHRRPTTGYSEAQRARRGACSAALRGCLHLDSGGQSAHCL